MPRTETINIIVQTKGAEKDVKKLGKGLEETKKQGKATGVGISGIFSGIKQGVTGAIPALNAFKGALISTGVGAIVVAVGGLITLMSKSLGKATEFSKAMSGVAAVSNASAEELAALTQSAKDLGSSTAFTAVQVSELQTELAKLGFTTSEIIDATAATLDLAASLDVGLADAATLAGSTLRSFGLDTTETQRVVDVMAKSASSSALDFGSLTESLKLVAPTSRAVGLTIEQTTAMLGALANSGLKGSVAGTGLSKTFIELNKKGLTLEDAFQKINSSSNKLNTAIDLVGVVGAKSLQTLANSAGDIDVLTEALEGAEGAAKSIAETRLDNLAGDTTKLSSAWEGFLLNIEDGTGALNKLARGGIQFLTKSITFLQDAISVTAFVFQDGWRSIQEYTGAGVDVAGGYFSKFGAAIKVFANEAMLSISEIPLIGSAIPKELVEANLKLAEQQLDESNARIQKGVDRYNKENLMQQTAWGRYAIQQEEEAKLLARKQSAVKSAALEEEITEEVNQEALDAEKKRLEEVAKLRDKFNKAQEDLDAKTEEQKLTLQRERAIAELDALKTTEEEKRQLLLDINALYDQKESELAETKRLAKEEKDNAERAKEFDAITKANEDKAKAEEELQNRITQSKFDALNAIMSISNQESALGKAAFIAKQLLAGKEMLMEAKNTLGKINLKAAESSVDTAAGASKTASIGFPQNIPFLIGYAAQAVGIIGAIKSAVGAAKGTIGAAGAGGSTPSIQSPRGASAAAPSFNIVGQGGTNQLAESIGSQEKQPIKAYVVSNDVTTAQSMERNIVSSASI
jgi:hypothetical protein